MYNSTLTRKTPLKAKTSLKAKTTLKTHSSLKAKKSLRQCTLDKQKAGCLKAKPKAQRAYRPKYEYKSFLTDDLTRCFFTKCSEGFYDGNYYKIHKHHIFGASNKANSEKYHFIIPLRDDYHNMSNYGVHNNRELDLMLKRLCQSYWLLCYGTKEEFIATFGKWW